MKIDNSQYTLSQKEAELKSLGQKLDRQIKSKEQEIKSVEKEYQGRKENVQVEQENNLQQMIQNNNNKMLSESRDYEDKISNYRDKLKTIENAIDKQESNLRGENANKIQNVRRELLTTLNEEETRLSEAQQSAQAQTKIKILDLNAKQREDKSRIEQQAFLDIQKYSNEHNQRIKKTENAQSKEMKDLVRQSETQKFQKLAELDKVQKQEIKKNTKINEEYEKVGAGALEFQKQFQQNQMEQLSKDFKTRYEIMQKNHTQTLSDLKTKFDEEVTKKVQKNSSIREVFEKKLEDPFYRVSVLRPKTTQGENEVSVSLPISEFEKDNVHLSTNARSVKITLNRNYSDKLMEEGNTLNKSTRSELFSKEFQVADILDARNITKTYNDGILTFKILKA